MLRLSYQWNSPGLVLMDFNLSSLGQDLGSSEFHGHHGNYGPYSDCWWPNSHIRSEVWLKAVVTWSGDGKYYYQSNGIQRSFSLNLGVLLEGEVTYSTGPSRFLMHLGFRWNLGLLWLGSSKTLVQYLEWANDTGLWSNYTCSQSLCTWILEDTLICWGTLLYEADWGIVLLWFLGKLWTY